MDGYDGDGPGWGIGHLAGLPVTLSVGVTLLTVLIILIILRVIFADVRVGVR